tara:strand:+ start:1245 stop:3962 length:2718 start_codon:yes stop_codon:yes gene_type:complete
MELYLNNIRVDLSKSIPFPLTFQISDIKDLSSRNGSSSKTITLPGTPTNHELMSTVFALTTSDSTGAPVMASFDTSLKATARYYQNGILQFEGICKLTECIKKNGVWTFNIVLFSDSIDITSLLSKIKLRELGWSEYNHTLTSTNQVNSWSGVIQKNGASYNAFTGNNWNGEGYYYGLIDYGYTRTSPDTFETNHIPLQVFIKNIVDKMFEKIGVTYESDFFETQQFKRLLLAFEGGILPTIDQATATAQSIETDQINLSSGKLIDSNLTGHQSSLNNETFLFGSFNMGLSIIFISEYNCDSGTNVDPASQIQTSEPLIFVSEFEGDFTLTYSGTVNVVNDVTLTNGSGTSNVFSRVDANYVVFVNDVSVQFGEIWTNTIDSTSLTNSYSSSFNLSLDLNLNISDVVRFEVRYMLIGSKVTNSTATSSSLNFSVESSSSSLDLSFNTQTILPGSSLNIKQFLPDMDCLKFFKGLINMFNLYVKPVTGQPNKLLIEPLNDFYNGSNNSINWTEKLDYSKDIKVTPTINFASKEYSFEFLDDKDFFNSQYQEDVTRQYGSKSVMSGSQFSKGETKIKLPFSNKLLAKIPTTNLIVPRNFQVKTDDDGVSEVVSKRGKSFVVQIKKGNVGTMEAGNWNHVNESSSTTARTEYPYVGHLDDINSPTFDLQFEIPDFVYYDITAGTNYTTNNLYIYHERFIRELLNRNGKMLTCSLGLNSTDINQLDFGNLVNIDGVVYRLQKIENYNSSDDNSTKAELIRLIQGEGIQTYTTTISADLYSKTGSPQVQRVMQLSIGDETTVLTTGVLYTFRAPDGMTLTDVRASLVNAGTGEDLLTIDILVNGVSVFSGGGTLMTIDASETTSTTATTPNVLGRASVVNDQTIQIQVTQLDTNNVASGLKMTLFGTTFL